MSDPLRDGTGAMLARLRREGVERILLATGDRAEVAERVTAGLGLDGLRAGPDARPEGPAGPAPNARTAR